MSTAAEQIAEAETLIVAKRAEIERLTAIRAAAADAVPGYGGEWRSVSIHETAGLISAKALAERSYETGEGARCVLYAMVDKLRIVSTRPVDLAAAVEAINASGGGLSLADALRATTPACEAAAAQRLAREKARADELARKEATP